MKNSLLLLLGTTFTAGISASGGAHAADSGVITFTGEVKSGTCNLDLPGSPVVLPPVRTSEFSNTDRFLGPTPVAIKALCDTDVSEVTFTFTGTASPHDGELWKNTGTAANVELGLRTTPPTGTPYWQKPGSSAVRTPVAGVATVGMDAGYYWVNRAYAPAKGNLLAAVTVSISYR